MAGPETPDPGEAIRYEVLDFAPPEAIVGRIARLHEASFGAFDQGALVESLGRRSVTLAVLAREDVEIVGYKVGYEDEPGVFRSWLGAVAPRWQGRGVGDKLLEMQHAWCAENGVRRISTEVATGHRPMLLLNLRHGFDIVGTRARPGEPLKVLFERELPAGDEGA